MHHQPATVTVITPTRLTDDRLGYLTALHASLHAQTGQPWKWVLAVDGADPGRVPAPITADPRVEILALSRRTGAATARNLALALAEGEWITHVDDDDLLPPGSIETRLRHAMTHRLDWVAGRAVDLLPDGHLHPRPALRPGTYQPGEVWAAWTDPDAGPPPVGHTTMLTRRDAALAAGGQGGLSQGEDYLYVLAVTGRYPGAILPAVTNHIRSHPGQMTRQSDYAAGGIELAVRRYSWSVGHALAAELPYMAGRAQHGISPLPQQRAAPARTGAVPAPQIPAANVHHTDTPGTTPGAPSTGKTARS